MPDFDLPDEDDDHPPPPIVDTSTIIDQIIAKSEAMREFWGSAHGWAPDELQSCSPDRALIGRCRYRGR